MFVSFTVYFNALAGDFVYDDEIQVVENPWLGDVRNIPTILASSVRGYQRETGTSNYYRPLMHIFYMLNYHLFGLKPWGFHLVNVLFHCGVSVLVFLVMRRLLPVQVATVSSAALSPAFVAAVLFASHPVHTEAVAWIAGLPDVAFAFFYLLSLYFYISYRYGAAGSYLLSILSFAVATLFKEPAITLPVILAAYDCFVKKSDETVLAGARRYIPYMAVSGAYLLVRYYALRSFAPQASYADLSTYQLIINVFPLFREYLGSLLWPFNLNFWHTFHPIRSLTEAEGMISVAATALFIAALAASYRKDRIIFFSLLILVVPLLPAFYIKAISLTPFAERYLYLPSAGFVFLLAALSARAREKLTRAGGGIAMVLLLIAGLYAVGTITRNNVWRNNLALWTDTTGKSPDNADAHNNLGTAYKLQGQPDRAIPEYQEALRLKPDFAEAHNNLGNIYQSQGKVDGAALEYQAALRLKPDFAIAHYNLGLAYASQRQPDKAVSEFLATVRLKPDFADAHNDLGAAYASQGQLDKAVSEFLAAVRLKPDFADAHYNLGVAYKLQGRMDGAAEEFRTVLRLRPDYREARQRLNDMGAGPH